MKYYKQLQLKNGTNYVLKNPTYEDAAELLQHMRLTSSETDYMFRYPDEITRTEAEEGDSLRDIESSADKLMLVAIVDGSIVAAAGFDPVAQPEKTRHRAMLGISIQRACWGQGIGSHMMAAMLELSRQAGYEQLELDVVSDNQRAINLYEKFGFKTIGTNEKALRRRDGQYQALHLMVCAL